MNCPFCHILLSFNNKTLLDKINKNNFISIYNTYICKFESCLIRDMSRYIITYDKDNNFVSESFILNNFHIYIDTNTTVINKLNLIFLENPVIINKAIRTDLTNSEAAIQKYKTLLLFS